MSQQASIRTQLIDNLCAKLVDTENVLKVFRSMTQATASKNLPVCADAISKSAGSFLTKGVLNQSGLAFTYQTNTCKPYYPLEAPGGIVVAGALTAFTFTGFNAASYMVTRNGAYAAIAANPANWASGTTYALGATATFSGIVYRSLQASNTNHQPDTSPTWWLPGFTLTTAAVAGDSLTVRDLNDCPFTFAGNILGTGLAGSGKPNSPYYYPSESICGTTGTSPCILSSSAFSALFANWNGGRNGDYTLTSATYINSATDADARSATGKSPGADLVTIAAKVAGVRRSVFYPTLSITSGTLTSATVGTPYPMPLVASTGASPYKGWFLETNSANCAGDCGTLPPGIVIGRGGFINGPFAVLTVAVKNNKAKITLKQTIIAPESAIGWTTGQSVLLSGFCTDGAGSPAWSSGTTYAKDAQVTYSGKVYTSLANANTNHQPDTATTWWVAVCTGNLALDGDLNGTRIVAANSTDCTNTVNIVCLTFTHADITSHAPSVKGDNDPEATFAPTTAGSYSWWMGAQDGAFQTARKQINLTVAGTAAGCTGSGLVWNCASGTTPAQVNSAIASGSDGMVLTFAAGTYSWPGGGNTFIDFPNNKGVTLKGAGAGNSVVTINGNGSTLGMMGTLSGNNTKTYRITGFTFQNAPANLIFWFYGNGTLNNLRIDNNTFSNFAVSAIAIFFGETSSATLIKGVIDHNTFTGTNNFMLMKYLSQPAASYASTVRGTANNAFLEDNTIDFTNDSDLGSGCIDIWQGGTVVFRNNYVRNCLVTAHGVTHGATVNFEVYRNDLGRTSGSGDWTDGTRLIHHQGSGEMFLWGNSFAHTGTIGGTALSITHYRSAPPGVAGYSGQRCDGGASQDQNRSPSGTYFGYACWMQPGRAPAGGAPGYGTLAPVYAWMNTDTTNGNLVPISIENPWGVSNPAVSDHIKPNRDYYDAVSKNAQTSTTSPFNGTVGMGFGTFANRPTTCTTSSLETGGGVGYWATDTQILYRCSATNTWSTHYAPYTYPHPLVGP